MGGDMSKKVEVDQIKKEVKEAPVVMYTRQSCGYCSMAKDLLDREDINYKERDLDVVKATTPDAYQNYVNGLVYVTRQTTVPQIFICGEFIGGFTQLHNLRETKKLMAKIDVCANNYVV